MLVDKYSSRLLLLLGQVTGKKEEYSGKFYLPSLTWSLSCCCCKDFVELLAVLVAGVFFLLFILTTVVKAVTSENTNFHINFYNFL